MTQPTAFQAKDRHPIDGVLLALHDGELGEELDASREHVEQCSACRARTDAIAERAAAVRHALQAVGVPPVNRDAFVARIAQVRTRRVVPARRRPSWQAAAAVLVLAVAAAASPIRGWIRRVSERSRTEIPAATSPPRVDSAQTTSRSGATISFAPPASGAEFTVRFDSLPDTGLLTIDSATSAVISARVVSGAGTGGDDFVVLPGELRVRNASSSHAAYVVSLPNSVGGIRVIVAGRQIFAGRPPASVQLRPPR